MFCKKNNLLFFIRSIDIFYCFLCDYQEKRKSQRYDRFENGADEQAGYVIEMYPKISGITTEFIQGSHDETHKINGGATLGRMIALERKDMSYLGQDHADIDVNGVRVRLRHPGGGVSKYRSDRYCLKDC